MTIDTRGDLVADIVKQLPKDEKKEGYPRDSNLTPGQVRYAPEEAVRQEVVLALQDKKHFEPDIVEALFAREQEHFLKDVYRTKEVSWPETASEKPTRLLATVKQPDGKPYIYTAEEDGKVISSVGVTYLPDRDSLARDAFQTLSVDEKKDVLSYLVKIRYVHPEKLIEDITVSEKDTSEIMTHLMDLLYENRKAYNYEAYNFKKTWEKDNIDPFVKAVSEKISSEDVLQAIIAGPQGHRLASVGILMGEKGFPRVLTNIRATLDAKTLSAADEEKLDYLGRQLLGNTDLPFHRSIKNFYEATHEIFTTYEAINEKATKADVERLQEKVFPLVTSSQPYVVVSDACGTGRIANMLAAKHDERVGNIIGIDISTIDLKKAQASYDAIPGHKTEVSYKESDWKTLDGIADESVDVFEGYGRSFMHAKDEDEFLELLAIRKDKLKPDGVFTCNFGNPNKGAYLHNRQMHLDVLNRAEIPLPDDASRIGLSSTVDSPDGINFVDRFAPQIESIVSMGEKQGFEVEIIERLPISGQRWGESEDVYFVFKKKAA